MQSLPPLLFWNIIAVYNWYVYWENYNIFSVMFREPLLTTNIMHNKAYAMPPPVSIMGQRAPNSKSCTEQPIDAVHL